MWHIGEVVNQVEASEELAKDLRKWAENEWGEGEADYLVYRGKIFFNPDHSEHMDFISDKRVQRILKKHKVKGDICFGSLEGDNAGTFWGYRFDGKGGMKKLTGVLTFNEDIKC